MTSPPAAPGAGGLPQPSRPRPQSKTGRPDGGTTSRRELSRHARFGEISPEVGILDERAMSQALADDPAAFELLAAMTRATDENLRAAAIRLSASIVLERARAGRPTMGGISRLRTVRGAADGDLDIDGSIEGVSQARAEARPVSADDLVTVQWAKAPTAFAVVVDRSGSMSGARLAAAATVAAACALRAPTEHAVLSFAGTVDVIRPLTSDITPAAVAERLLRVRGHGVTRLGAALKAAGEQLASARARRRVVILLSDCRSTDEDDALPAARALDELIILAPGDDHEQAAHLATLAGARWAVIDRPLDAAAALDRLLQTRVTALKSFLTNGPDASSSARLTPSSPSPRPARRRHCRRPEIPGRRLGDRADRVHRQLRRVGEPQAVLSDLERAEGRAVPVLQLTRALVRHQVQRHRAGPGQPDGEDQPVARPLEEQVPRQFLVLVHPFGQIARAPADDVPQGPDDGPLVRAGTGEEDIELDCREPGHAGNATGLSGAVSSGPSRRAGCAAPRPARPARRA